MKYLIVKITNNNNIEYGKTFDNVTEATEQVMKLNEIAKENGFDTSFQFMVFPKEAE